MEVQQEASGVGLEVEDPEGVQEGTHVTRPIHDLFYEVPKGPDLMFLGPTVECVCGNRLFYALISFDDDRTIGSYFTEMVCVSCGALIRGATEIDEDVHLGT